MKPIKQIIITFFVLVSFAFVFNQSSFSDEFEILSVKDKVEISTDREKWEDVNGDWVTPDWFDWDVTITSVVVVFGGAELGTTVHMLIAAAEDEEGDRIKNVDW